MSFIIWYKVAITDGPPGPGSLLAALAAPLGGGLPVVVSNDVYSGQYILDAELTLTMLPGAAASTFDITLLNLPQEVADQLKSRQPAGPGGRPLQVNIYLGYFEDLPAFTARDPVMTGAITRVTSEVNAGGILETRLQGQEITGYTLRTTGAIRCGRPDQTTAEAFLRLVLENTDVTLASGHGLTGMLDDYTLHERNALDALRALASGLGAPLVIRDGQVFIKGSVGAGPPVDLFSPDINIVRLDDQQTSEEAADTAEAGQNGRLMATARRRLAVTVLGNPKLRVGQRVRVQLPDGSVNQPRIDYLIHRFSTSSGYICDLQVVEAAAGELTESSAGAHALVDRLHGLAQAAQRSPIDIGQVREYRPGGQDDNQHRATLDYGQSPAGAVDAPSVATPVDDDVQLYHKPIASPFAFHQCGLVVPVYAGMRALLAHNRGLVTDAVVAGFLWSDEPRLAPPPNQEGDYWLCLPTDFGGDGLPQGKTVNDLTDIVGRRVVQARGLHILVGADALPDVGTRPTVADDLDDQILIEHAKSGTRITITEDGIVTIKTDGASIALTNGAARITVTDDEAITIATDNHDITLTNGGVTLKLSGAAVEVS